MSLNAMGVTPKAFIFHEHLKKRNSSFILTFKIIIIFLNIEFTYTLYSMFNQNGFVGL